MKMINKRQMCIQIFGSSLMSEQTVLRRWKEYCGEFVGGRTEKRTFGWTQRLKGCAAGQRD